MPSAGEIAKSVMCGNSWFCAEYLLDLALPGVELHDFFHDPHAPVWTKNSSYYSRRPEPECIALLVSMINQAGRSCILNI